MLANTATATKCSLSLSLSLSLWSHGARTVEMGWNMHSFHVDLIVGA